MGNDILFRFFFLMGLTSGIVQVAIGLALLRRSLLPDCPERDLRLARLRQYGSAVLIVLAMVCVGLFLRSPKQTLYWTLALPAFAVDVVLSAMNQALLTEARKTWQKRRRGGRGSEV